MAGEQAKRVGLRNLFFTGPFDSGLRPRSAKRSVPAGIPALLVLLGGGSNSLLSPPAQLTNRFQVIDKALLFSANNSSRVSQEHKSSNSAEDTRGNKRRQDSVRLAVDEPVIYTTRETSMFMRVCVGRGRQQRLLEIDEPGDQVRPATGAALIERLQPTHRVLRCIFHRAFSYAVRTVP